MSSQYKYNTNHSEMSILLQLYSDLESEIIHNKLSQSCWHDIIEKYRNSPKYTKITPVIFNEIKTINIQSIYASKHLHTYFEKTGCFYF